jgi:hypothetical protein
MVIIDRHCELNIAQTVFLLNSTTTIHDTRDIAD